jgi:DNA protecting protein DprA
MPRHQRRPSQPSQPFTAASARASGFTPDELAALLAAGASAGFCRSLLANFPSRDAWLASPLLPDESTHLRSVPPYHPLPDERLIGCMDVEYPARFFDLHTPPPVLFLRGEGGFDPSVAIVGSRSMSKFGSKVTTLAVHAAAQAGAPVLSGLAPGVDTLAHRTALDSSVRTSAFVANLASLSSAQMDLAEELLASGGFVCSENPSTLAVQPVHFLARNRLIAALAYPLVPVEGALTSGTASTLRAAAELRRPIVAAIPRPAFKHLPTAALPLALALDPVAASRRFDPPIRFDNVPSSSASAANAACTSPEDLDLCIKVLYWLHR